MEEAGASAPPPLGSLIARATFTTVPAQPGTAAASVATSRLPPPVAAAGTRAVPGRNKVTLDKGFSQMDWMRLTRTHPDLAGAGAERGTLATRVLTPLQA